MWKWVLLASPLRWFFTLPSRPQDDHKWFPPAGFWRTSAAGQHWCDSAAAWAMTDLIKKKKKKRPGNQFSPPAPPPPQHTEANSAAGPEPRRGGLWVLSRQCPESASASSRSVMGSWPDWCPSSQSSGPLSSDWISFNWLDEAGIEYQRQERRSTSPRPMTNNLVKQQRNEISGEKLPVQT